MTKRFLPSDVQQLAGSERWYRHQFVPEVLYTEGVKQVADQTEAYWLLDEIAFAQHAERAVAAEAFQVWKLVVQRDCTGTLTCKDGNGKVVFTTELDFVIFPEPEFVLWFAGDTILLPFDS